MQPLLLLHGAVGAMDQLAGLDKELSGSFLVQRLNFNGHGGTPFADEPFSIKLFAEEVIEFLHKKQMESIHIFGYSMGGYVAMYLAKHFPEKVKKIITLATKFNWDKTIAAKEMSMLNPATIEEKLPAFAGSLQKRHAPGNWKTLMEKTASMIHEMGKENPLKTIDYTEIGHPVLLMLGDRDKMVTFAETLEIYKSLPKAQLAVLPNTPHPVEMVNTGRLAFEIRSFLLEPGELIP